MDKQDNSINTIEQALTQLRATRSAGQYVDWDTEKDMPDILGADGIAVDGHFSLRDFEALCFLAKHFAR
jgi:hypothetical protein